MMFMGSSRYPTESAYADYILAHGGATNGYTLAEETNFHLKVESAYLYGAMDRFAAVFVQPQLSEESMEREVQAVDAEFSKNALVQERVMYQVLATQALPEHPMHHFSTGNAHTLNLTHIHHQLTRFYRQHYSSNLMALVVLGREPLAKLQYDVMHLFSHIPNRHLTAGRALAAAPPHPYVEGVNLPSLTFVKGVSASPLIILYFPLPAYIRDHLHQPTAYLLYLLSHAGPGSLVRLWQRRGVLQWVNATMAMDSEAFSVLQYQMVLVQGVQLDGNTGEAGVPQLVLDMVASVFAYVQLVRAEEEGRARWEEWKRQLTVAWDWQETQDPMVVTPLLAKKMQTAPARYVLDPPSSLLYDAALLDSLYARITPSNLMLHIASPTPPAHSYERVEPYYHTRYTNLTLPASLIHLWTSPRPSPSSPSPSPLVTLPSPNPFIPTNFSILPPDVHDLDHPLLLASNDYYRLYYNQAIDPHLPLSLFYFSLSSPIIDQSPLHRAYLLLSLAMSNAALTSTLYQARLVGYTVAITATPTGVRVEVEGVTSTFPAVLKEVVRAVVRPRLADDEEWGAVRDALVGGLREFSQQQVYQQALYLASLWMEEEKVSNAELVEKLVTVRSDSDDEGFRQRWVDTSYVECFGYGNVDPPAVRLYADTLMRELDRQRSVKERGTWKVQERMTRNVTLPAHFMLQLPAGDYVLYSRVLDGLSVNSAAMVHYVTGEYSDVARSVLLDMLALLIAQPAFDALRTRQQLGYIVHTQASTKGQAQRWFTILVQSGVYDAALLSERLLAFMRDFGLELESIRVKEWERARSVLLIQKKMEEDSMREKGADWWGQIQAGEEWRRKEQELDAVRRMQHADIIDWYRDTVMDKGKRVRFRVEVDGRGKEKEQPVETEVRADELWLGTSERSRADWKARMQRDDSAAVTFSE